MSISAAYDSWSEIYDTNENKTRDLDRKATVKILTKYSFNKVLELGCGTGKNTVFLLQKAKHVTGLDFSEKMLEKAKSKIKNRRVNFQYADLNKKWPVPDYFFDLTTCNLTLEHIENLNFIFEQAYEKLKAGGIFFVCELHPYKQYLGSKARFEKSGNTIVLQTFTHHISDYLKAALFAGFKLLELNEWFDDEQTDYPRLISFVFKKILK